MRASVIQMEAGTDPAGNMSTAAALIEEAARDRAALVSLPEMWSCLGGTRSEKLAAGEPLPPPGQPGTGPLWRFLSETARRHAITLHGGSIGERDGETLFNTTLLFGPDGREQARYRKIHLFDITTPSGAGYRESALFGAGADIVVAAGPPAIGLSICYDVRFPELYTALRQAGADIIAVPAAFTAETGRDHWEVLLRARAIETQCFVLAATTTGWHRDAAGRARQTWGHAMVVDPWGAVLAARDDRPGIATADLDLAGLARVRAAMPVLAHRRLGTPRAA